MPRPRRGAEGGLIYHALNRATARATLFDTDEDYATFQRALAQAVARHEMRLLAYCVLPDHFHLLLWPRGDCDLSRFMRWLTVTHTQRWHAHHRNSVTGHLYQGRFKSFPVQSDEHFLTVCRYVERNALRADRVLSAPLRQAALRAVLRRAQPADAATGTCTTRPETQDGCPTGRRPACSSESARRSSR